MKKYYFFAALATVGLFASCSSDEDFSDASEARQTVIDESAPAPIKINIGDISRGTGTVGGNDAATNVWAGQKFNLYMFKKGSFELATFKQTETSPEEPMFENAVLTAPNGGASAASYDINGSTSLYFPPSGQFTFWAYRVDDAGTGALGVGEPKAIKADGSDATSFTDAEATEIVVPFEIDGSQDLMVGVADTAAAKTALEDANFDHVYTAYASRRDVNPKLNFKHLLTRLYFNVMAATKDVSEDADDPGIPGWEAGFKVTDVTVYSASKGNIIVAYKQNYDNYTTAEERINWTDATEDWADYESLKPMHLMSRQKTIDQKAAIALIEYPASSGSIDVQASYDYSNSTSGASIWPTGVRSFDGSETWYKSNAISDKTGLPTGEKWADKATAAAAQAADPTVKAYLLIVKGGDHADANSTPWSKPTYTIGEDANEKMITLEPVVPEWNGVPGTPGVYGSTDASATYADETALDAAVTAGTAEKAGSGDATALAAAQIAANVGKYFFNTDDNKVYEITEVTAAVPETLNSATTRVGEALLVAPADANGYKIKITYTRTKKVNATTVTPITGTAEINLKREATNPTDPAGPKIPSAFKAGKGYNVTFKLYSDGEVKIDVNDSTTKLDEFTDDPDSGFDPIIDLE